VCVVVSPLHVPRVELFGVSFSRITFSEVCAFVTGCIETCSPTYIVTPNVDHICQLQRNPDFQEAYAHAGLVLADGTAVLWAARLCGRPLPEKLSGSDLVPRLSAFAAAHDYSVFLLGAAPGVAAQAAERLRNLFPTLRVAGVYSPPFGFARDERLNAETVEIVRRASPDICFVALSAPQQEIWMHRNYRASGARVMIGVGAGIDFVAGVQKRAPEWVQRAGGEWLWRLMHEPRRLWRRYLVEDIRFMPILWREFRRQRFQKRGKSTSCNQGEPQ